MEGCFASFLQDAVTIHETCINQNNSMSNFCPIQTIAFNISVILKIKCYYMFLNLPIQIHCSEFMAAFRRELMCASIPSHLLLAVAT